jgi:hypothetical protein
MKPEWIDEWIEKWRAKLPANIEETSLTDYELILRGPSWHLRVSCPWRLIKAGVIETSSGVDPGADRAGKVYALAGLSILDIDIQSRSAPVDIALFLSNGMVFEVFSENTYDDWLLNAGDIVVEGPMQPPPVTE